PEQLTEGIRAAASGDALLAPEVTRTLIQRAVAEPAPATPAPSGARWDTDPQASPQVGTEPLSERERDVLAQAALGLSNTDIGLRLFTDAETVKTHMPRILAKLQLRNRIEAVAYAPRCGIVAD